jgi:hypothetical protein
MNANSLTTMNIQGGMSSYNTLLSSLFSTQSSMPLGSLSNYPRSGIDSYSLVDDGTGNKRRQRQVITPQKYYITESQVAPSASISMSTLLGEGSLLDEIEEMDLFVSDSLCASFIDMDGNFYINKAIEEICNQANCYQYLLQVATINDLKDGLIYVDPGVLSRMGGIIKTPLLDDGYLTYGQYEYTIPTILTFSSIPLSARGNLWPYLDASWSVSTLYTSGAIDDATYLSLQYIDETDDEFNARMATQTSYSLLSSTIAPEIITVLDTTKTYMQSYASTVSAELSASLVELFDTLVAGENEILAIASQISLDNIEWDGKYDDYPSPPV